MDLEDPEMRKTGTLADPLLTREERNLLRAKMATHMRTSARHYESPVITASRQAAARSPAPDGEIDTTLNTVDTLQRLQRIAIKAGRERRL